MIQKIVQFSRAMFSIDEQVFLESGWVPCPCISVHRVTIVLYTLLSSGNSLRTRGKRATQVSDDG